jgi:hypothetical protein
MRLDDKSVQLLIVQFRDWPWSGSSRFFVSEGLDFDRCLQYRPGAGPLRFSSALCLEKLKFVDEVMTALMAHHRPIRLPPT